MREILLRPRILGAAEAQTLEEKGLIRFIRHPDLSIRQGLARDYFKGEDFLADKKGFHSVTITYTEIFLSSHPKGQDEIVFMWDPQPHFRPLFFVFALHPREEYVRRLKSGSLGPEDYLALRVPYNDAWLSSFIVRSGTVHCELTDLRSTEAIYPSFFVLEALALQVRYTEEERHGLHLKLEV
jgi:hypothetical protein